MDEQKEATLDEIMQVKAELPNYIILAKEKDINGETLKKWREYRKLSSSDVRDKAGVSTGYLSQLETGKVTNPSFAVIVKLCRLYSVKLTIGVFG